MPVTREPRTRVVAVVVVIMRLDQAKALEEQEAQA